MPVESISCALTKALPDAAATAALGAALAGLARAGDALLLSGPLGAGKTTLARAFLVAASGDADLVVPSPSYTLVQSYATRLGIVHHFDLWRLDGPAGLAELGWDEALADIVLLEWPERLGAARPEWALEIALVITGEESREALLRGWPERLGRLA
ncbi:MAG: tRNA (adenosine(37)-N6)-threonylcarbamoyltransferase complex ATPase subunit type 1 TsaE [Acetobacteraceae bacterium]